MLRDFSGDGVVVHRGDPRGTVQETLTSPMTTYTACLVDVYDTALSVDLARYGEALAAGAGVDPRQRSPQRSRSTGRR